MLVFALVQGNAQGLEQPADRRHCWSGRASAWPSSSSPSSLQRDPMLDLSLFKRPAMVGVSLGSFTLSASIFAMFLYLTIYLQEVLGYGPFQAGLRFLPITMLSFLVAPIAGKLTVRVKSRYLMGLGLLLVALGCDLMTHVQADSTWTVLLPGFIVAGIGIGITNPVLASASVSVVPPERSGMASGSASTFRQVGIATGIAGLGAVFLSQIRPNTVGRAGAQRGRVERCWRTGARALSQAIAGNGVREAAAAIPVPAVRNALIDAYKVGYAETFNHLMVIATVVAAIGAVGSLALVRQRDFVPSYAPVAEPVAAGRGAARRLAGGGGGPGADRAGGRAGSRLRRCPRPVAPADADPGPAHATDERLSPMKTRLTEILGIEHPVMLAGMGGVSYAPLVPRSPRPGGSGVSARPP